MEAKCPYFRPSTPSQRKLLFETWEETGSIKKACEISRLSRETFYHWKPPPHRTQSNGIAERYVQTLKAYLTAYSWETPKELRPILRNIPREYNDRPHQGDELKGLSPNEYAKRLKQGTKMCPIR